jgi:hypothetical protein
MSVAQAARQAAPMTRRQDRLMHFIPSPRIVISPPLKPLYRRPEILPELRRHPSHTLASMKDLTSATRASSMSARIGQKINF